MTTYAIDTENSITAHASKQEAGEGATLSNQQELAGGRPEPPDGRWNPTTTTEASVSTPRR